MLCSACQLLRDLHHFNNLDRLNFLLISPKKRSGLNRVLPGIMKFNSQTLLVELSLSKQDTKPLCCFYFVQCSYLLEEKPWVKLLN